MRNYYQSPYVKSRANRSSVRLLRQISKQKQEFVEYGIKPMRFKARYGQLCDLYWYDLPYRTTQTKCWKQYRKTQYRQP